MVFISLLLSACGTTEPKVAPGGVAPPPAPPPITALREMARELAGAELPLGPECTGSQRWAIKTGAHMAPSFSLTEAERTSIQAMRARPWPDPSVSIHTVLDANKRFSPVETTLWELRNIELVCFKSEDDCDYHLVVRDHHGETMIAEIPDPQCVASPRFRKAVAKARVAFDNHPHLSRCSAQTLGTTSQVRASMRGVGFFDKVHGGVGEVESNGIELHPVVAICFGHGCSLD